MPFDFLIDLLNTLIDIIAIPGTAIFGVLEGVGTFAVDILSNILDFIPFL